MTDKLIDTVTDVTSEGIFTYLNKKCPEVPEYLENPTALNLDYYYRWSGNKITSPLIDKFRLGEQLTAEQSGKIAEIILNCCKSNWDKLYLAMTIDYSPIENVDGFITETTTNTGNKKTTGNSSDTGTDTHDKTGTDKLTNTGTDKTATSGSDTVTNTGTDTNRTGGQDTVTNSGTDKTATTGTDTVTNENTESDSSHINSMTGGNQTESYNQALSDQRTVKEGSTTTSVNDGGTSDTVHKITGYNEETLGTADENITTVKQTVTDTLDRNMTDTTNHTGNSGNSINHQESEERWDNTDKTNNGTSATKYGKTDTRTLDTDETTKYGKTDTRTLDTDETTKYGKTDTRTLDTVATTTYNNSDKETLNLSHNSTGSEDTTGEEKHELHRHGNIGVTTNQQMINEEIELRKKFFLEMIYSDVDRFLTIPIY